MDTGDIISMESIDILDDDNIETLHDKLSILGKDLLEKTLPLICDGKNNRVKQDDSKATYTRMIAREDELLNFDDDVKTVYNKIRAFSPWPLSYFCVDGMECKIISATYEYDNSKPKEILISKDSFKIGTRNGYISILRIKPFGVKIALIS